MIGSLIVSDTFPGHCYGLRAKVHLVLNVRLCNLKQVVCEPHLVLHEVIGMRLDADTVRRADLLAVQEGNDGEARSSSKEFDRKGHALVFKTVFFKLLPATFS